MRAVRLGDSRPILPQWRQSEKITHWGEKSTQYERREAKDYARVRIPLIGDRCSIDSSFFGVRTNLALERKVVGYETGNQVLAFIDCYLLEAGFLLEYPRFQGFGQGEDDGE